MTSIIGTQPVIPSREEIARQLYQVYRSQIGIRENSFNAGKDIEKYQKAVDGKASKEPYFLGFIQWGANEVCKIYGVKNPLWPTERCYTLWTNTPDKYKRTDAIFGSCFVQKMRTSSTDGHIGFNQTAGRFSWDTIEANTNVAGSREGDGVYASTRWATGTTTKKVLGHIDIALMIQDAIIKANRPVNQPEQSRLPVRNANVRGDWNTGLDQLIMDMVTPELLNLPLKRMKKFAPEWHLYSSQKRREFFADLLFAMTSPESSYDRKTMYQEPDQMGYDSVTGYRVVSEGLLQLSYHDAGRYPGLKFDWRKDAEAFKADMLNRHGRKSWKAESDRTILNPEINVHAAMTIVISLLTRFPNDEFADCLGRYWSCMRRYKGGSYRDSFLGICSVMKRKGYKT